MTAGQKMKLALRSSTDPVAFAAAFVVAGYHEARDDDKGFGWGIEGYGKRSGAAYLDAFDGNMIGNGILPSILHQDPRYFRMGHGTFTHRLLYSLATNVICKHDNTGKWEPNYSNVRRQHHLWRNLESLLSVQRLRRLAKLSPMVLS